MPSDDRVLSALDAMGVRAQAFRAAIAITANEVRDYLAQHRQATSENPPAGAVLGAFASGRIDPERFSRLLTPAKPLATAGIATMEQVLGVLDELERQGDELFRVRVDADGDLVAQVDHALAKAGSAFRAARVANRVRLNQLDAGRPEVLDDFPFRHWSKAERNLAPPLVIETAGVDMVVPGLTAYLDGNQALALLVEGQAPPAPLAQLISPGVFVMQTDDAGALHRIADVKGPAVVAVMPAGTARFVHLPGDGVAIAHLEVSHLPAQEPRRPLGSVSVFQQQQQLRQLAVLAGLDREAGKPTPPEGVVNGSQVTVPEPGHENGTTPGAAGTSVDPVGALAAWLLARVDLSDLESGAA